LSTGKLADVSKDRNTFFFRVRHSGESHSSWH